MCNGGHCFAPASAETAEPGEARQECTNNSDTCGDAVDRALGEPTVRKRNGHRCCHAVEVGSSTAAAASLSKRCR